MKFLRRLFNKEQKRKTLGPLDKQEQALRRIGREQFIRLREKGLSIPIFTL